MLMLSCKADLPCIYVELILSYELRPILLMQCAMRHGHAIAARLSVLETRPGLTCYTK